MKIFIANRGEIACRIASTAHKLGIQTCGVYTPQDAHSRHIRLIQEVTQLPSGELSENYLNGNLLIEKALKFHANAIHPGYGFLAENPQFAESILAAGLIWIGPRHEAMRLLGDKISGKEIATKSGVPIAPWIEIQAFPSASDRKKIVKHTGLPLLIKAARGGGGRGQRIVRDESQFEESLRTARSESLRAFGSEIVFAERFLDKPRHIEVQILADHFGNIFTLGERDCTIQRRNQKVIEESPAVILDELTRKQILNSAAKLAAAVNYTNAGTIEFLAQKNASGQWEYFFMELNARLQVEHPVTEMTRGIDLVELQLRIAQNENLSQFIFMEPSGHAIEVRLCAENPENHFLPSPGPITDWNLPSQPDYRLDSGFETGDVIPQEYDSLFAKLIVHADSRQNAISRITKVLEELHVGGVLTNQSFLQSVLAHPDFLQNEINTRWIEQHPDLIGSHPDALDSDLTYWGRQWSSELFVQRNPSPSLEPPPNTSMLKHFVPGVQHGSPSPQGLIRLDGEFTFDDTEPVGITGWIGRFEMCVTFFRPVRGIQQRKLLFAGQYEMEDVAGHHGPIVAQVPGIVLDVRAQVDEVVEARDPILVVEAMKIEMPMSLPIAAKITSIHVKRGDRIQPGQTLVTWEPQT